VPTSYIVLVYSDEALSEVFDANHYILYNYRNVVCLNLNKCSRQIMSVSKSL